jgi:outer membrane lipoprotein-sorting protein
MFDIIRKFFGVLYMAVLMCSLYMAFNVGSHLQGLKDGAKIERQRIEMQAKIDDEVARREEIARRFEAKLDNIKIVNTTINKTVQNEIQKQIYTDCKYPVTGSELINSNATQLNNARNGK